MRSVPELEDKRHLNGSSCSGCCSLTVALRVLGGGDLRANAVRLDPRACTRVPMQLSHGALTPAMSRPSDLRGSDFATMFHDL